MFRYRIESFEPPTHITFCINEKYYQRLNIMQRFPEYYILNYRDFKKYYVDINDDKLVFIENEDSIFKSMREPTKGFFNYEGKVYRPAIQSDIDKHENNYDSENWKLYQYLQKFYESYEVFLSEDQKIGIHIRKSENDTDLILERFEKDEDGNFKSSLKLCLPNAVRELDYCNVKNLKGKYRELINKNLDSRIIRKDLLPYVKGVFKVKSRY